MSNTLKDKANHFRHHTKPENDLYAQKSKHKYSEFDIPMYLKDYIAKLDYNYKGNRSGNNRHDLAKAKIFERKKQRHTEKHDLQNELKSLDKD